MHKEKNDLKIKLKMKSEYIFIIEASGYSRQDLRPADLHPTKHWLSTDSYKDMPEILEWFILLEKRWWTEQFLPLITLSLSFLMLLHLSVFCNMLSGRFYGGCVISTWARAKGRAKSFWSQLCRTWETGFFFCLSLNVLQINKTSFHTYWN